MDEGTLSLERGFDPYHLIWRVSNLHYLTIAGIAVKHIARYLPEHEALNLRAAADAAMTDWDRDFGCGNGNPVFPQPPVFESMAQLNALAASLPTDSLLRNDVTDAVAALAERAGAAIRSAGDPSDVRGVAVAEC